MNKGYPVLNGLDCHQEPWRLMGLNLGKMSGLFDPWQPGSVLISKAPVTIENQVGTWGLDPHLPPHWCLQATLQLV